MLICTLSSAMEYFSINLEVMQLPSLPSELYISPHVVDNSFESLIHVLPFRKIVMLLNE